MTGIGVIGYGYWGPNLVRNFTCPDSEVVAIDGRDAGRTEAAKIAGRGTRIER